MNCMVCVDKFCAYKVPVFSSFSLEELEEVFRCIKHRDVKKGEILLREGEDVQTLFIINEGTFKMYQNTKDGREQILSILRDGDTFGELYLLKEKKFEGYLQAITDCNICTLNKEEFQRILMNNPKMALKVLEVVGDRLQDLERLAVALADKDGEVKLAYVLVELAEKYGQKKQDKVVIDLPISKEEMASYAGITRETLSRKLKIFRDLGIIQMDGHKQISITDYETLKQYVG